MEKENEMEAGIIYRAYQGFIGIRVSENWGAPF